MCTSCESNLDNDRKDQKKEEVSHDVCGVVEIKFYKAPRIFLMTSVKSFLFYLLNLKMSLKDNKAKKKLDCSKR